MKKLIAVAVIIAALLPAITNAQNFLYTRFDNKYATPILSQLQDYRAGMHFEQTLPKDMCMGIDTIPFIELGGLHEQNMSVDLSAGIVFSFKDYEVMAAYNYNDIQTLGSCATLMLKYKLK